MSSITISGDSSGTIAIAAPAVAGTNTMTLAAATGTLSPKVFATAQNSTSGSTIDFTNIPSWVTRVTIMFAGVSLSGTDSILVQIGNGSFTTTGYISSSAYAVNGASSDATNATTGFVVYAKNGSNTVSGICTLAQLSSTIWVSSHSGKPNTGGSISGGGDISFSGAIDRVRITVTGTNTFDAGTINLVYE